MSSELIWEMSSEADKGPDEMESSRVYNARTRNIMHCPICLISDTKPNLEQHYLDDHNILISRESFRFRDSSEFEDWKATIEENSRAQFCKLRKPYKRQDGSTRISYVCTRTGYAAVRTTPRLRQRKNSVKIEGYCPASIEVVITRKNTYKVQYTKAHVGHSLDLGFLRLSAAEKKTIASKIALNVPPEKIIQEILDSVVENNLEELHLVTKRDIHNIEQAFNRARPGTDSVSVHSWVEEMQTSGIVRFYKPQDTELQGSVLKKEDFFLVFFNDLQLEMLKLYGGKCVCVDGTHGLNSFGYELTTVMVLDDLCQGIPVAFLISNRGDVGAMTLFFSVIVNALETRLETAVFMSGIVDVYFKSWVNAVSSPEKRLYCASHVLRAWRQNLKKVTGKANQDSVYKTLRALLEETDTEAFKSMLEKAVHQWKNDPDTKQFARYFTTYYKEKSESWAYCHRLGAGINTNMAVERMHKTIKYLYLHAKNVRRLDKAVHAVMCFLKDKVFDKIIAQHKGTLSDKMETARHDHVLAQTLDALFVSAGEDEWDVSCDVLSEPATYKVKKVKDGICCRQSCEECGICIHTYACTCLYFLLTWDICEHIHFICVKTKLDFSAPVNPPDDQVELVFDENPAPEIKMILVQASNSTKTDESTNALEACRSRVLALHRKLESRVLNCSNIERLKTVEKSLKSIDSTMRAEEELYTEADVSFPKTSAATNKRKIEPQKGVVFIRKKTNKTKVVLNPTNSDKNLPVPELIYW